MSVSTGLYIQLDGVIPPAATIIKALLAAKWSLDDHGAMRILPLGDDDSFNWTTYSLLADPEVWSILDNKQKANETVGVAMLFDHAGIGGELLIDKNGLVTFSATVNRREQAGWSDVTWYLERILPAVSEVARISSWEWTESL